MVVSTSKDAAPFTPVSVVYTVEYEPVKPGHSVCVNQVQVQDCHVKRKSAFTHIVDRIVATPSAINIPILSSRCVRLLARKALKQANLTEHLKGRKNQNIT